MRVGDGEPVARSSSVAWVDRPISVCPGVALRRVRRAGVVRCRTRIPNGYGAATDCGRVAGWGDGVGDRGERWGHRGGKWLTRGMKWGRVGHRGR